MKSIIEQLKEIAAPILKAYETDLDHDAAMLAKYGHGHYAWSPRESGTSLASLCALGKGWAKAITSCPSYQTDPWYWIDTRENTVTQIDLAELKAVISHLPPPTYTLHNLTRGIDYAGGYGDERMARQAADKIKDQIQIREANTGEVIYTSQAAA